MAAQPDAMKQNETIYRPAPSLPLRRQSGASLLIALIMLIVVMLLGATASRMALMNEKASRNDRDRQIAFQAAEAALRDAELLLQNTAAQERKAIPGAGRTLPCGLCRASGAPLWLSAPAHWAQYGRFSGRGFPYGATSLAVQPPRYLIELLDVGKPASDTDTQQHYRITAVGFGSRASSQVELQTLYAVPEGAPAPVRLSWREINEVTIP